MKDMDKRAVFSHVFESNVISNWGMKDESPCETLPHDSDKAYC